MSFGILTKQKTGDPKSESEKCMSFTLVVTSMSIITLLYI